MTKKSPPQLCINQVLPLMLLSHLLQFENVLNNLEGLSNNAQSPAAAAALKQMQCKGRTPQIPFVILFIIRNSSSITHYNCIGCRLSQFPHDSL